MKAIAKNGRAKMRNGRATTCSDDCCGECATWWKATHCPNPGTCVPYVCDIYVCQTAVCCDGSVPPVDVVVGSVIQYQGWCYTVQPGDIPASAIPPGAVRVTTADFCSGTAFCIPGDCSHPACQCTPGPWLYWQACPCPTAVGDGFCRVIRLEDYGRLSQSIGSDCIVADVTGTGQCYYVSLASPRAETLPPGCIIFVPALGTVGPTCCECCPGCGYTKISVDECNFVHSINPMWGCYPQTCCCTKVKYRFELYSFYKPGGGDPHFLEVKCQGEASVDFTIDPFGVTVPVRVSIRDQDGTTIIDDTITLVCGAHNVTPPATEYLPGFTQPFRPVPNGPSFYGTVTQSGLYSCVNYVARYNEVYNDGLTPPTRFDYVWSISTSAGAGSTSLCGRGCSGAYIRPGTGPCDPITPSNEGTEAFI